MRKIPIKSTLVIIFLLAVILNAVQDSMAICQAVVSGFAVLLLIFMDVSHMSLFGLQRCIFFM